MNTNTSKVRSAWSTRSSSPHCRPSSFMINWKLVRKMGRILRVFAFLNSRNVGQTFVCSQRIYPYLMKLLTVFWLYLFRYTYSVAFVNCMETICHVFSEIVQLAEQTVPILSFKFLNDFM